MKKTLALLLALSLTMGLFLAAQAQGPVQVVTSFYPLYIFAQNVLDGVQGAELSNLTHPTTGCLHDYQLLTSDMRTLEMADVLIINGGGMEPFLDVVSRQFYDLQVVDSSQGIILIAEESLVEDGHDGHEDEGPEEHDHGEYNAHIWLDPRNAAQMARNMAEGLKPLFPQQEALIEQNTTQYAARLENLHQELEQTLKDLPRRELVTFHEAFPYFARAYDLHVVGVLQLEPDEALTPQMLARLVERVVAYQLPPLFTEPQYDDRAARAVAQETGAPVYQLDPIVTGDGTPTAYEEGMRRNAQTLVEALSQP